MTYEEAIKWFEESPFMHEGHEPYEMAINALKLVAEQTEPNSKVSETPTSSEKPNNCKKCKWWNESYGCHWKEGVCHYVPKAIIPKQCVSCDSASRIIEAYSRGFKDGADAVKAMPQTFTADGIVFAKMDEPQTDIHDLTDCDFCKDRNCKDCEGGKDEPQTDCAWR